MTRTLENAEPPMLGPVLRGATLARGTLVSTDLDRLSDFCRNCLGLGSLRLSAERLLIRDRKIGRCGAPYWVLEATAVSAIAVPQSMLNHWGVTVDSSEEVDRAYENVRALQSTYDLKRLQAPRSQHQSYSFYIADADSNWWEIEYREPGARYPELKDLRHNVEGEQ